MEIKKIEKKSFKDHLGLKKIIVDYFKYLYREEIQLGEKIDFEGHGEYIISLVTEDDSQNMMVALKKNVVTGFIMYDKYNFKNIVNGRICELYVDPSARRNNIGSRLVFLAEKELAMRSYYITADKDAIKFWEKKGYYDIKETADNGCSIFIKNSIG